MKKNVKGGGRTEKSNTDLNDQGVSPRTESRNGGVSMNFTSSCLSLVMVV